MNLPYSDVDWSQLEASEGNAHDIPALLCEVENTCGAVRVNAIGRLFWRLYNQGTVYQATAKALPFLFAALESLREPDADLATLVARLSSGSGFMEKHQELPEFILSSFREFYGAQGRTIEQVVKFEMEYVLAIRDYASGRLDLLFGYLDADDANCRSAVAECLGRFPCWRSESLQILRKRGSVETDEEVKAMILESIDRVAKP